MFKKTKKNNVVVSGEEVEKLKQKIVEIFCSKNIIGENFKNYEQSYYDLRNHDNIVKLFTDEELINTARLFFENNLNITLTSKAGYMHRNTLIYRLDKIKTLIGLDVRNFSEAVVLENLINLHLIESK